MVIGPIENARDQIVAAGSQILLSLDLFRPALPANRLPLTAHFSPGYRSQAGDLNRGLRKRR